MKSLKIKCLLLVMASAILIRCELLPEQNEDCEKTRWDEPIETLVFPRFFVYTTNVDANHSLSSAEKLQISGSTQRILCSGESGFKTSYSKTYDHNALALYVYQSFDGDITKFYFENDNDHLISVWRIKATFKDGMIFETEEMVQNSFYNDLNDAPDSYSYKFFELYLNDTKWYSVTK